MLFAAGLPLSPQPRRMIWDLKEDDAYRWFEIIIFTMKNDGCSWCAFCCSFILCPFTWCCSKSVEYFEFWNFSLPFQNSSAAQKTLLLPGRKRFFWMEILLWECFWRCQLNGLVDILGSPPIFLADQKSWKCQVYLQIQCLIFSFAGNTVHISTQKITSSRNRIKSNFSKRVAVIFYTQMPLFQPDLWFACSALNPRNP